MLDLASCEAADDDETLTSDPRDLTALAAATGRHVELVPV